MKRPSFQRAVLRAAVLGVVGVLAVIALGWLVALPLALRLALVLVAGLYALDELRRAGVRAGRVVAFVAWLAVAVLGLAFEWSFGAFVAGQVVALWLLRRFGRPAAVLPALGDGVLHGLALAAGAWALSHTGSLFLSLWSFFLVIALDAVLPTATDRPPRRAEDAFARAERSAETALRRLSTQSPA